MIDYSQAPRILRRFPNNVVDFKRVVTESRTMVPKVTKMIPLRELSSVQAL